MTPRQNPKSHINLGFRNFENFRIRTLHYAQTELASAWFNRRDVTGKGLADPLKTGRPLKPEEPLSCLLLFSGGERI